MALKYLNIYNTEYNIVKKIRVAFPSNNMIKDKIEKSFPNTLSHVLRSSGISRKSAAMIVRYSQKKECNSFVSYCLENLSNAQTLEPMIRFRCTFLAKCTSPYEDFN